VSDGLLVFESGLTTPTIFSCRSFAVGSCRPLGTSSEGERQSSVNPSSILDPRQ